jgi:hypothetical protein
LLDSKALGIEERLVPSLLAIKWVELEMKTELSRRDLSLFCEEEASDEATACE